MACFRLFTRGLAKRGVVKETNPLDVFNCGRVTCAGNINFRMRSVTDRKFSSAYDAEGKTMAIVMTDKRIETLCVQSVSAFGFKLHNGAEICGAAIVFPFGIFSWNVQSIRDVTEESLTLFKVLEPKLDIVILGYGRYEEFTPDVRVKFNKIFKNLGVRYEALPTEQAIGTYNFMSEDFRYVAAALIPPPFIDKLKLQKPSVDLKQIEGNEDDEIEKLEPPNKEERKFLK